MAGEGYFPTDVPYEELELTVPSGEQRSLVGLWNYLQILGVSKTIGGGPTDDDQEVSFNGGKTWTRLRRGIQIRIGAIDPGTGLATGTTVLKVRNPSGDSIDLVIAMGYGDIKDARLTINTDITAFEVDFADPSAFKTALDAINTKLEAIEAQLPVNDDNTGFFSGGPGSYAVNVDNDSHWQDASATFDFTDGDFLGSGVQVIQAAAANPKGNIFHYCALHFQTSGTNETHKAKIYARVPGGAAGKKLLLGWCIGTFNSGDNQIARPVKIPAGWEVVIDANQAGHCVIGWREASSFA